MRVRVIMGMLAVVAGCGAESSRTETVETPYSLEVRLVDAEGTALPLTDGAASWSLGLPEGPSIEVTYWAERSMPAVPLVIRGVGASIAGAGGGDPWDEPSAESELSVPLTFVDEERRTIRTGVVPPARAGRAVLTAFLGGAEGSVAVDFLAPDATLSIPAGAPAVADGVTEIPITVTGTAGQVITIETTAGIFVAPFFDVQAAVTLAPSTSDGTDGSAIVGLVAETAGPAFVSVTGAPSEWVRVDFEAVRLVFGEPQPVDFQEGRVVHEICVALNTANGDIQLAGSSYDAFVLEPSLVPVTPYDSAAPSHCPAAVSAGYAVFRWAADGQADVVTAAWSNSDGTVAKSATARVVGDAFAGYGARLHSRAVGSGDPHLLVLEVALTYLPVGSLGEIPAAGVGVTFMVVPEWDAVQISADAVTGPNGLASAVYEVYDGDVLQVFLQPEYGSTIYLGQAS